MTKQTQKQATKQEKTENEEHQEATDLSNPQLNEETNDLLAEIDEALGDIQDADSFVRSFVQRGGQ
jgi:ubiquitin-like protein Pup